ncbi:putative reverse transcriptase/RNA-dependent DNA polymerase [Citrus sinensis]|uniref:Reverse transcriptase/RNA-dependent DNA polymerase n=1 Tax=Citrus sinensis TaxID=2711 RepID=A0ACB8KYG0_CITSI|nr:putative reverse transcriptase/RNA-dependent DNA polymerase [Citrus sinensis]
MNAQLDQPFSEAEITEALSQMHPTKAPGPDGLPAAFFQKHWKSVSQGVIATCLQVLNGRETFSNLLKQAEAQQLIHGIKFNKELSITHLLFADDSLIFTRATREDCTNLKEIFDCYAAASGQIFNYEKSSMFFSESTRQEQIAAIKAIFQLQVVSRHAKYLGLPSMVGRNRTSFFKDIKLRVLGKISSWQAKLFSCGGKEGLIKAVAQAVPVYAMSVFKLPIGLCEDMQKAIAGFWWGSSQNHKSIHYRGGLGFRDLSSFNHALVAKQSWRIIQEPKSLVARVLKARYFKHSNLMQAQLGSHPSFIWRSILWGRKVIEQGLRWRIGDGQQVLVYQSPWLPRPMTFQPISPPSLKLDTTVTELINEDQEWKEEVIRHHFLEEDADQMLKIPLPRQPKPDQVMWHHDKKGNYSVKSGYQLALKLRFPDKPSCSGERYRSWHAI